MAGGAKLRESLYRTSVPSDFGRLSIVWREAAEGPKVRQILLPDERSPGEEVIRATYAGTACQSCPEIKDLADRIQRYLRGEAVDFQLSLVELGECPEFQRRVLLAEYRIPRGWVSTYGRIARSLGVPKAARAVGTALARNPFPIIIPCHRTIRSHGDLGGFGGGVKMKRALLELEGVEFSASGKVVTSRFYY